MKMTLVGGVGVAVFACAGIATAQTPKFDRVYSLRPEEGVFAYSRISPDGKFLAYASQSREPRQVPMIPMTVTVVDLTTKKVTFSERGLDAYWSTDGERIIYSSNTTNSVSIRHQNGEITRNAAPMGLGDYYSWGVRDGKNLILTIQSNYYYLDGDKGVMPAGKVVTCPGIGQGERPLLSRDGMKITTFVRGSVVARDLTDCDNVLDTGLQGAKADFSWDSRYIAFHVPKAKGESYDIVVVDLKEKTVRNITASLPGSSFYPNWTKDGRLSFRYDGDDYRGFMFASNVLSVPAKPLSATGNHLPGTRAWKDLFPETPQPKHSLSMVLIWATWSAHSTLALRDLDAANRYWKANHADIDVMMTTDPGSKPADAARLLRDAHVSLSRIPLGGERLTLTESANQMPTTLLFRDGKLIDHKLGAQTAAELEAWVGQYRGGAQKGY